MSRIFIDRPIFAWVLAIIVMLAGIGSLFALPIEQYPDIAPTNVNIQANYPGASAETVENSVTQILEQQLTGLDGLLYFSASSRASPPPSTRGLIPTSPRCRCRTRSRPRSRACRPKCSSRACG
jgi:hypothetical protein